MNEYYGGLVVDGPESGKYIQHDIPRYTVAIRTGLPRIDLNRMVAEQMDIKTMTLRHVVRFGREWWIEESTRDPSAHIMGRLIEVFSHLARKRPK